MDAARMASRLPVLPSRSKSMPTEFTSSFLDSRASTDPPHGVVLLVADVIELLSADGGAVPGEGPAQQVIGGHPVVVAGLDHEGQARLPDAVFVVGQQAWEIPRTPAAVRWLTPFSCRRRDRVRENSAFKFLTSNENQYTWYSINDSIPVVKSIFLFSAKFLHKSIEIIAKWKGSFLAFCAGKCYHRP